MYKFEMVKKALEEKTRETDNWLTLTTNIDARHTGKYATMNMVTRNTSAASYKTLNEVITEFGLNC